METGKVALDNNAVITLKLRHQTMFVPNYSTGNRSKIDFKIEVTSQINLNN